VQITPITKGQQRLTNMVITGR